MLPKASDSSTNSIRHLYNPELDVNKVKKINPSSSHPLKDTNLYNMEESKISSKGKSPNRKKNGTWLKKIWDFYKPSKRKILEALLITIAPTSAAAIQGCGYKITDLGEPKVSKYSDWKGIAFNDILYKISYLWNPEGSVYGVDGPVAISGRVQTPDSASTIGINLLANYPAYFLFAYFIGRPAIKGLYELGKYIKSKGEGCLNE